MDSEISLHPLSPGLMSYPTTHTERLKTATVIGLDLKVNTEEVAFFTKIPTSKITAYRDARTSSTAFLPMP